MASLPIVRKTTRFSSEQRGLLLLALFFLLFASKGAAQSQAPSLFTSSQTELRQYLQRKYVIQRADVQRQDDHLQGPRWYLSVEGVLTPPAVAGRAARTPAEVRAVAQAFFSEEARLLGLTQISEMHELASDTSKWGQTDVAYQHYVAGLRLEGTWASLTIQPEGHLSSVRVQVVPTSPELRQALNRPTLSDADIRLIIKRALEGSGLDPRKTTDLNLEKVAFGVPPYVVWKADLKGPGWWLYTIDAFTGQILERMDAVRTLKR